MAEQFAFDQAGGQAPAIDRYKGTCLARAEIVEQPRQHALADPGLAQHQYRHIRLGH